MTQPLAVAAETCDQFLRQGREFLAQGDLAPASAAGWRAALAALEAHTGNAIAEADFRHAARILAKDPRAHAQTAEWAVGAITLRENVADDWLDADGVARRLDDVQRLALLVRDIANPPQTADDILARSRECLKNGYLAVASEQGWEAVTHAAKTYAESLGHDHIRSNHLDRVAPLLMDQPGGEAAGPWSLEVLNLLENADPRRNWLDATWVGQDLDAAERLITLINELTPKYRIDQVR